MLREFKEFVLRGNVVDLAIAVVIGGSSGRSAARCRGPDAPVKRTGPMTEKTREPSFATSSEAAPDANNSGGRS